MSDLSLLSSHDIIGMYFVRLEQNPGLAWVNAVSNLFPSDRDQEKYGWLGQVPQLREWVGERKAKGLSDQSFTILNKLYESTLQIEVKDARRDKTGQIQVRVNELADRTLSHWASLLSTLILNGETQTAYDGEFFFDTDHSEGSSGSQDNDISVDISTLPAQTSGSTTAPSIEEMQQSILLGASQIMSFVDDQGEPMNEGASEFLVMVPTSLWITASKAVALPTQGRGTEAVSTNATPGLSFTVAHNPRLDADWTAQFAVFRTDGGVKALIRQEETGAQIKAKAEGSEFEFDNNAWQFGIDTSRNVGYGFWQRACLVTMT
jgi:phage major head subunit gpT-like protein